MKADKNIVSKPAADVHPFPPEMVALRQWINARVVPDPDGGKSQKFPVNPHGGSAERWQEDPNVWADFDQVKGHTGFVYRKTDGLSVLDLDYAFDEDGNLKPHARELVDRCQTYTEISISGNGLHIVGGGHVTDAINDSEKHIEVYSEGRWVLMTGVPLEGTDPVIRNIQDVLDDLARQYRPSDNGQGPTAATKLTGGGYEEADIDRALNRLGVEYGKKLGNTDEGTPRIIWILHDRCLTNSEHVQDRGAAITLTEDGRPGYVCHHNRCAGKGWADVRDLLIPDMAKRLALVGQDGHATILQSTWSGQWRWVNEWRKWIHYRTGVWAQPGERYAITAAIDDLKTFYGPWVMEGSTAAERRLRLKYANEVRKSRYTVSEVTKIVAGKPGIHTEVDELNQHPWLLNVENGTLDLKTRTLLPHTPDHLLTMQSPTPYDPTATAPKWQAHMNLFHPDPEIQRQIKRDFGLALVGSGQEEFMPIWYGTGSNGKSTTAIVIKRVLGEYALQAAGGLFIKKNLQEHTTGIADMYNKRIVFSTEIEDGQFLNEKMVKDATGGEGLRARRMREDNFDIPKSFTPFMLVNHKPGIRGTDDGIWRRIRLVPWSVKIADEDRRPQEEVVEELVGEASGILNWMLEGLADWQEDRQWIAPGVVAATGKYRKEEDELSIFLDDTCVLEAGAEVSKGQLYTRYVDYCQDNGDIPVKKPAFGKMMIARAFDDGKTKNVRVWKGLRLMTPEEIAQMSAAEAAEATQG